MQQVTIAIDLGNSNTDVGLVDCKNMRCLERFTFPTEQIDTHAAVALNACLARCAALQNGLPQLAASTVIPSFREGLEKICAGIFAEPIIWTRFDPALPLTINYKNPEKLGADRLADALYAHAACPGKNSIIIDSGTTITADLLKNGAAFCGGAILPGVLTQLSSLHRHTGLLPQLSKTALPETAIEIPGLSTEACMLGGVRVGIAGALSAIVALYSSQCAEKPIVLATGGGWNYCAPWVDFEYVFNPDLTLIGIALCAAYLTV
ncbi:MAG: type III pantothenate kinase [Chitinivibrionales bacterium]|nr:type III pantothenate kinase [Chitinivibrionales bacterium]